MSTFNETSKRDNLPLLYKDGTLFSLANGGTYESIAHQTNLFFGVELKFAIKNVK